MISRACATGAVASQVNKLKGEKYKLLWKESPDFVRLASKLDCTIVPFAAVGGKQLYLGCN